MYLREYIRLACEPRMIGRAFEQIDHLVGMWLAGQTRRVHVDATSSRTQTDNRDLSLWPYRLTSGQRLERLD